MSEAPYKSVWVQQTLAITLAFVAIAAILWPTSVSFVDVWTGGETYSHGFIILPISIWLIWQKRKELYRVLPAPNFALLALMLAPGAVWLMGMLAGVRLFEQLGMVGLLIAVTVALLGWRLAVYFAFPLLFLVFAVPMGEELIPPMMEFTATFTVEALRLTGIPVFRDGLWFQLPTTRWSVVEACSGVRYIIASVTLGFLYAYIAYHTLWKRIAFVALAAVVPVLANGVRAYTIVLIGHYSGGELAAGVDHLIYGWVFFGFVMLILFWLGGFWQEKQPPIEALAFETNAAQARPVKAFVVGGLGVLMVVALQAFAQFALQDKQIDAAQLVSPASAGAWQATGQAGVLRPSLITTDFTLNERFQTVGGDTLKEVSLAVGFYPNQRQAYEAVAKRNAVVGNDRHNQQVKSLGVFTTPEFEVQAIELTQREQGETRRYLVWQWYRIAGVSLSNPIEAKLYEVYARLTQWRGDGAWIAIATPLHKGEKALAESTLQSFVTAMVPELGAAMDALVGVGD